MYVFMFIINVKTVRHVSLSLKQTKIENEKKKNYKIVGHIMLLWLLLFFLIIFFLSLFIIILMLFFFLFIFTRPRRLPLLRPLPSTLDKC